MWLLIPPLPHPLASQQSLLSGCPKLLGLLFILATIAPSHDYASKPAISDWCPLGLFFYHWWKGFRDEVNVSNLSSPQGESQSYIFNLETCCAVRAGAIPHPAGVNVTEAIWVSSKRTHFFYTKEYCIIMGLNYTRPKAHTFSKRASHVDSPYHYITLPLLSSSFSSSHHVLARLWQMHAISVRHGVDDVLKSETICSSFSAHMRCFVDLKAGHRDIEELLANFVHVIWE